MRIRWVHDQPEVALIGDAATFSVAWARTVNIRRCACGDSDSRDWARSTTTSSHSNDLLTLNGATGKRRP